MCKDNFLGNYELRPARVPLNGDLNNSLIVSEVAAQLAEIGDKVELGYQRKRQREDAGITLKAVCIIALFIAFRVLIWREASGLAGHIYRTCGDLGLQPADRM